MRGFSRVFYVDFCFLLRPRIMAIDALDLNSVAAHSTLSIIAIDITSMTICARRDFYRHIVTIINSCPTATTEAYTSQNENSLQNLYHEDSDVCQTRRRCERNVTVKKFDVFVTITESQIHRLEITPS